MTRPPRQELLAIGELLQEVMMETEVETIIQIVADTAIASADAVDDQKRKAILLWYGKHLQKLMQGPPPDVGVAPVKRPHGVEALKIAFQRLTLRANRMSMTTTLPAHDFEWVDTFTRELQTVATKMGMP